MTDTKEKMHGWYSQKQYENKKTIVLKVNSKPCEKIFYLDKNENEVEVTEVTSEKKYTSNYDDVKYMGELKSFSRVSRI